MCAQTIVVTGGAGFIGSAVIRYLIEQTDAAVVNVDKLTYAGNLQTLASVSQNPRYRFEHADICKRQELERIMAEHKPTAILHLAAETHVDRSIDGPATFIETNVLGTYTLLEVARDYWMTLDSDQQTCFRFHHVSTDEVFGSLGEQGLFSENSKYEPNSPYSASKASADHLVRAWHHTYGLPVVITNCSNNYGPFQYPEKLIPLMILNAIEGTPLPVYGQGNQVRDWLYVEDHARGLYRVLTRGRVGEVYTIGGLNEKTNLEVVNALCALLDERRPVRAHGIRHYAELITYVQDRPGHDRRYAIDASKIERELGWVPNETFESGLAKTVQWYLNEVDWCRSVQARSYRRERLGLSNQVA